MHLVSLSISMPKDHSFKVFFRVSDVISPGRNKSGCSTPLISSRPLWGESLSLHEAVCTAIVEI